MTTSSRIAREREAREAIVKAERNLREAREAMERLSLPDNPGQGQYAIDVRFERGGGLYTFLVLITGNGRVYTTAVKDGGTFDSFDAFVEWLRGKEPYSATNLTHVKKYGGGVELV